MKSIRDAKQYHDCTCVSCNLAPTNQFDYCSAFTRRTLANIFEAFHEMFPSHANHVELTARVPLYFGHRCLLSISFLTMKEQWI